MKLFRANREGEMSAAAKPHFERMEREEIHALLARNHVGRIAYARGPHIDIEPLPRAGSTAAPRGG